MREGWSGFIIDVVIAAVMMAMISGGAFLLVPVFFFAGVGGLGVFGLIWPAILLGPVVVFVRGLAKQRSGMVLSPILATVVPALGLLAAEYFSVLQVRFQEKRELAAPSRPHDTIILALQHETGGCNRICAQILVQTSNRVAVPERWDMPNGPTLMFRKAEGETCYGEEAISSLTTFVAMGVTGACAVRTKVAAPADGLVFQSQNGRGAMNLIFPGLVNVRTFSVIERSGGEDRLLGRWAEGSVGQLVSYDIGPFFSTQSDLWSGVGAPVRGLWNHRPCAKGRDDRLAASRHERAESAPESDRLLRPTAGLVRSGASE
jgi:hypothetical protein